MRRQRPDREWAGAFRWVGGCCLLVNGAPPSCCGERDLRDLTPEERLRARLERPKPVLEEMREWLDESRGTVPPESLTGKAMSYLHHQWPKLERFLEDGRLPLDTNDVENSIRPFVLGRKAWLFADTVAGAEASANLYSPAT
jgi:hypothetical protein